MPNPITAIFKTDDLFRSSVVMAIASLTAAFLNYLFQLSMGILLTPAEYGVLYSLTSLMAIITNFSQTFQISVAKFTSRFKIDGKRGKINYLQKYVVKRTLLVGLVSFLLMLALTPVISKFLKINNWWYIPLLFSSLIFVFALPAKWGILQGMQRFLQLGASNIMLSFLRLGIGIVLVFLGLGVGGGLAAYIVAYIAVFLLTSIFLKDLTKLDSEKLQIKEYVFYTWAIFLGTLSFSILTNIDIVIVKHYLNAVDAGNYAAISVLGKVVFYAPHGITVVMFAKTSDLFENGQKHRVTLLRTLIFALLLIGIVIIAYWFFPDFIMNLLFSHKYLFPGVYLFKYTVSMGLFAISFILMNYCLSTNRTKIIYSFIGASILEICLIVFFHSTIGQIVDIMLISGAFCLALTFIFYLIIGLKEVHR